MKKVKVRITTTSIAGLGMPEYDQQEFGYQEGDLVELHPVLARLWIASGLAESAERETAAFEPPEKAVMPAATTRRVKHEFNKGE